MTEKLPDFLARIGLSKYLETFEGIRKCDA